MEQLSQDKDFALLALQREIALKDELTRVNRARKRGLEEGIKKGEKGKAIMIAKTMLDEGMPIETIAKLTGLSIVEINELK